jgi:hypothetical protein
MKSKTFKPIEAFAATLFMLLASAPSAPAAGLDHWTTLQVSTNYFRLDYVTWANGVYVAYGTSSDDGVILSSDDGLNWVLRIHGTNGSGLSFAYSLIYTGTKFFALGGIGPSGISSDGKNWSLVGLDTSTSVAYGRSTYVAVGAGIQYAYSFAFTNWTDVASGSPPGATLTDIAYGAGIFVARGQKSLYYSGSGNLDPGHIYTSTNVTSWVQRNFSTNAGNYVSYCNGIFIAPAYGTNYISLDGINWDAVSTGVPGESGKVMFANGLFMARLPNQLMTSTDGTNWTLYPQPLPGTSLATDGSRLVTVSLSTDGTDNGRFNGFIHYSDVLAGISMRNGRPPQVAIEGLIGRTYRVEATDSLPFPSAAFWTPLATQKLPSTPFIWMDNTATNASQRYYRVALLP